LVRSEKEEVEMLQKIPEGEIRSSFIGLVFFY
jgi:hypothetical protein